MSIDAAAVYPEVAARCSARLGNWRYRIETTGVSLEEIRAVALARPHRGADLKVRIMMRPWRSALDRAAEWRALGRSLCPPMNGPIGELLTDTRTS